MDMKPQNPSELLLEAYKLAPVSVREFIDAGGTERLSEALVAQGGFDETTIAKIENEVVLAILGITNPSDFEANLEKEAGVRTDLAQTALRIATEEIFGPLALMETEEANATGERLLPAHEVEKVASTAPIPPSRPVTPPQAPQRPIPPPQPTTPILRPQARTMASDVEAAQAPHQETPRTAPVRPVAVPVTPVAPPRPVVPAIAPIRPSTPPPAPEAAAIREDMKKYGIDPYREPIE